MHLMLILINLDCIFQAKSVSVVLVKVENKCCKDSSSKCVAGRLLNQHSCWTKKTIWNFPLTPTTLAYLKENYYHILATMLIISLNDNATYVDRYRKLVKRGI